MFICEKYIILILESYVLRFVTMPLDARRLLLAASLVLPVVAAAQSSSAAGQEAVIKPDLELGEYLSSECTTCHRKDQVNRGIPGIFGKPKVLFLQAMRQYQDGTRPNQVMQNIARSLSEEELVSLGAYFELAAPQ